jgi:uncharacterized protein
MSQKISYFAFIVSIYIIVGCGSAKKETKADTNGLGWSNKIYPYPIEMVDIKNVKINDDFWLPIIKKIQDKTISYAIKKCEEEGRLFNFLLAGGKVKGEIKGAMPFDDTDVYKIIEGASITLISSPNKKLDQLLDSLISIISIGQEKDGYLTTWRTVNPTKPPAPWVKVINGSRFESLEASHELYNVGHMYEAAAVHYKATGKKNFLNIALKNANLLVNTFGDEPGKLKKVPGHQIVETGLIQLYKITKKQEYLALSKYFLDNRGNTRHHNLYGSYSQDHMPVINQDEVVGHAVRAVYMYAAMTDIAAMTRDASYTNAVNKLWENMISKKMYVTGGIGSKHDSEAFGENYELPNHSAYSETCAAIGSIYWNHRLFLMNGDVKYYDIIERTLYNSMIAGLSLDGTHFFYPNTLESDGKYTFNKGHCTRQGWFDCSCCPTNIIRFLPSMASLIYSQNHDNIYVNMFVGSNADFGHNNGRVSIQQTTSYPWKGGVSLRIKNNSSEKVNIKVRVPHWLRNEAAPGGLYSYTNPSTQLLKVTVDGKEIDASIENGYLNISVLQNMENKINIDFSMAAKHIICSPYVKENQSKLSLEYGPIMYAFEEIDQKEQFNNLAIDANDDWKPVFQKDLLGGVVVLRSADKTAVPYYAWSNRGVGKMKIWLNTKSNFK